MNRTFLLLLCLVSAFTNHAQFNYTNSNVFFQSSVYEDISASGVSIPMTNGENGVSSSPQNIGFNFLFNGSVFTQFSIHADGIVRLGALPPGAATAIVPDNSTSNTAVYASTDPSFQNILMPFFADLVSGSSAPAFYLQVDGAAPNRTCTIQFSNLRDNNNSGGTAQNQFNNLEFQVRLFESTNDIEFIYGNFQPSANPLLGRFAAMGIKANNANFIGGTKRFNFFWSQSVFADTLLSNAGFAGLNFRRSHIPASGLAVHFYSKRANDVGVADIYADNLVSQLSTIGGQVQALVRNEGTNSVSNIDVTLSVTGANLANETINIPSLEAGAEQTILFSPFAATNAGTQQVQVSVITAADDLSTNNTRSVSQQVTSSSYRPADPALYSGIGLGFGAGGSIAQKIYSSGSRKINQIVLYLASTMSRVNVSILEDDGPGGIPGTSLFTSPLFFTNPDNTITIPVRPAVTVNGDYYISVMQTSVPINMSWNSIFRPNVQFGRQYGKSGAATVWVESRNNYFVIVEAREQVNTVDVGLEGFPKPGCTYKSGDSVSVTLRNFAAITHDFATHPVTITAFARDPSNNVINFPMITRNTGTLAPDGRDTIVLSSNYNSMPRGYHFFSAVASCAGDGVGANDSIGFVLRNSIAIGSSYTDSVCPSSLVSFFTPAPETLQSRSWYVNGQFAASGATLNNIRVFAPSTIIVAQGLDYRNCLLRDSLIVPIRTTGLPVIPQINYNDTVLRGANQFRDTFSFTSQPAHTYSWFDANAPAGNSTNQFIVGPLIFPPLPRKINLQVTMTSDGCTNYSTDYFVRYGTGILLNNSSSETVCDTSLYDNGGPTGNTIGPSVTKTFYPATAGKKVQVSIHNFSLGTSSRLDIYDGESTATTRIASLTGNIVSGLPAVYTAGNPSGALTFRYTHSVAGTGWLAGLSCVDVFEYRSLLTGNWEMAASWERRIAGSSDPFVPAPAPPRFADGIITVRAGHTITIQPPTQFVDQIIVEAGGKLIVNNSINMDALSAKEVLTVFGELQVNANMAITGSFGNPVMRIMGNAIIHGSLELDTAYFSGSANQTITGSGEIRNPVINNAAGVSIINSPLFYGRLGLLSGVISVATGGILDLDPELAIDGGSNLSHVDGAVAIGIDCSLKQPFFPLGKNGAYRPVQLSINTVSTCSGTITASIFNGPPAQRILPPSLSKVSTVRYYTLTRTGSTISGVSINMRYGPDDGVTDFANLRIAKDDGAGNWNDVGGVGTTNNNGAITSTISFNSLSDFVLANAAGGSNSLPVKLLHFSAARNGRTVDLRWTTTTEINLKDFTIERSVDGRSFNEIGVVAARGSAAAVTSYEFKDIQPASSINYYRLRSKDRDQSTAYSNIVRVDMIEPGKIVIRPNPVTGIMSVAGMAQLRFKQIQVLDMHGRLIKQLNPSVNQWYVGDLPMGTYTLRLVGRESVQSIRFIKQ